MPNQPAKCSLLLPVAMMVTLVAGAPLAAQDSGPWRIAEQTPDAQFTRIRHDRGAEITLYKIDGFEGKTPLAFGEALQADEMMRAGCAPLERGAFREVQRGTFAGVSTGAQRSCSFVLIAVDGIGAYGVSIDSRDTPVGAHASAIPLVRTLAERARTTTAANGSRGSASSPAQPQPAPASTGVRSSANATASATPPAVAGSAEAQLRAAMVSIPASHRPFGMVLHLESDVVNGGMRFAPYMLFPNGYAVDECRSWNLATTAPTPAALRAAGTDCDVLRWRKVGNKYVLQDTDGDWFAEADELAETRPFRLGQRVDYAVGNVGGASVGGGLSTVSTLNSGELRLTAAGAIDIGAWNSATYSGVGGVYSSSGQSRNVRGQYLLDGYVLAIRDAAGVISYGLIFLKIESGKPYLYLNGELYWLR